jgi:hypothetical protein
LYFIGDNLTRFVKVKAANDAYSYFAQSMAICRPYLDAHETLVLESRFASIRSRDDYIAVTEELRRVAASTNQRLPEFKPW